MSFSFDVDDAGACDCARAVWASGGARLSNTTAIATKSIANILKIPTNPPSRTIALRQTAASLTAAFEREYMVNMRGYSKI